MTSLAMIYLQHLNAKALGRDQPFGVWAIRHGYSDQLFKNGQRPYDVFADTPRE